MPVSSWDSGCAQESILLSVNCTRSKVFFHVLIKCSKTRTSPAPLFVCPLASYVAAPHCAEITLSLCIQPGITNVDLTFVLIHSHLQLNLSGKIFPLLWQFFPGFPCIVYGQNEHSCIHRRDWKSGIQTPYFVTSLHVPKGFCAQATCWQT